MTSEALLSAVGDMDLDSETANLLSSTSEALFMNTSVLEADPFTGSLQTALPPFPLDTINAHMYKFILSASKAYANGYVNSSSNNT